MICAENEEKSTRNANCPVNVKGCAGKCLAGYVLDESGCETCKCRTSGTMDSDIKVDGKSLLNILLPIAKYDELAF